MYAADTSIPAFMFLLLLVLFAEDVEVKIDAGGVWGGSLEHGHEVSPLGVNQGVGDNALEDDGEEAIEILSDCGHNDIYKQRVQPNLISSIKIYFSMKGKPLINEANLHKISKTQQFLVRSKTNLLKNQRLQQSHENLHPESTTTELDFCIDALQAVLQQDKPIIKQHVDRVLKLIVTFKNRSSMTESQLNQSDLEESQTVLRRSESKFFGKIKDQTQQENKEQLHCSHDKMTTEHSKMRPPKIKFGKQNMTKGGLLNQVKLDRLHQKIAQQQKQLEEYRDKASTISEQKKTLLSKYQHISAQNERLSEINTELHQKLTALMEKQYSEQRKRSAEESEALGKVEELSTSVRVLKQRLELREQQLVSLFYQHL